MKSQYDVLMEDPESRRLLAIEAFVAEASEAIVRLMAERNVNKAELERRHGKSRAWVTQLLRGRANMTVRTLAEMVHVLGGEAKIQARPWAGRSTSAGFGETPQVRGGRKHVTHEPYRKAITNPGE
jgi:hypothetical protein